MSDQPRVQTKGATRGQYDFKHHDAPSSTISLLAVDDPWGEDQATISRISEEIDDLWNQHRLTGEDVSEFSIEAERQTVRVGHMVTAEVDRRVDAMIDEEVGAVPGLADQYERLADLNQQMDSIKEMRHEMLVSTGSSTPETEDRIRQLNDDLCTEMRRASERHVALVQQNDAMAEVCRRRGDVTVEVLSEVRDFGGAQLVDEELSHATALERVNGAMRYYPSDWVDASNQLALSRPDAGNGIGSLPVVRTDTSRARYSTGREFTRRSTRQRPNETQRSQSMDPARAEQWSQHFAQSGRILVGSRERRVEHTSVDPETNQIVIEYSGGREVLSSTRYKRPTVHVAFESESAIHEMAHRMEDANPKIGDLTEAFLVRRTTSGNGIREPQTAIGPREFGRKDHFLDPYFGREYDYKGHPHNGFHEVLSCGMESIFTGKYGGMVGEGSYPPDENHRAFVVGLLATS